MAEHFRRIDPRVRSPAGDRGPLRREEADLPDPQHFPGRPLPRIRGAVADRDDCSASLSASDAARTGRGRGRRALGGQEGGRRPVRHRHPLPGTARARRLGAEPLLPERHSWVQRLAAHRVGPKPMLARRAAARESHISTSPGAHRAGVVRPLNPSETSTPSDTVDDTDTNVPAVMPPGCPCPGATATLRVGRRRVGFVGARPRTRRAWARPRAPPPRRGSGSSG